MQTQTQPSGPPIEAKAAGAPEETEALQTQRATAPRPWSVSSEPALRQALAAPPWACVPRWASDTRVGAAAGGKRALPLPVRGGERRPLESGGTAPPPLPAEHMDKIANESTSELPASGRAVSPPQGAAVAPYPARTIDSTPRHLSEVSRNPEAEIHDQSRSSPAPQSPAPKEFERAPVANSIIGSESKISTDVEQEVAVIDNTVDAPTDSSASPRAEPQSRSAERKVSVTDRHQKSQQASRECISIADMESQIAEAKTEVLTEPEHQTLPPISIRSSIMQLSTASASAVRKSAVGDASRAAQENDASELPIPCDDTATAAYLPHISPISKAVQCATIDSAACSLEKRSSRGVVLPLLVAAPVAAELTAGTSTRVRLAHLGIVLPHLASPNQRRRRRKEQQQQKQERWQREESMRRRAAGDTTARMSKQFTLAQQRVPGFRVLDRDGRVGYEIAPMAALGWLDLIAGRMVPPRVNFGSGPRSKDGFVMGRRQR